MFIICSVIYIVSINEHFKIHVEMITGLHLQKATKKTDKPRLEDKDDLDVTELSNEDLLDQLVKYGVNPGPIVGKLIKFQISFYEAVPHTVYPSCLAGRVFIPRTSLSLIIYMTRTLVSLTI